ncbi:MAG: response regulator [Oscillochloridaceae bacterium umkhey_bin13]
MTLQSLRTRTLLAVLFTLAALMLILLVLAASIIATSFEEVEEQTAAERVQQVANALDNTAADLGRIARDYAIWDDTYAFVTTADESFISLNFGDQTFVANGLSYVAIVNPAGEAIYLAGFDLSNEVPMQAPAELRSFIGPNAQLLQHRDASSALAGLLVLNEGPYIIAAHPILTSQGEGPPAGTLIMARTLDVLETERLARLTRLPFTLNRLDDPTLPASYAPLVATVTAGQMTALQVLDAQYLLSAQRLPTLLGGPDLLLTVELPREIAQLGQAASRQYTLVLLLGGVIFGGVMLWLLERLVLRRTLALSSQVAAIEASRPGARISLNGDDEISQLGTTINQMLERLAGAQQQLAASEQRYRQLFKLSPEPMLVHDGQHIRYLNSAAAELLGNGDPAALVGQPVDPVILAVTLHDDGSPAFADRLFTLPDGEVIEVELVALGFDDHGTSVTQVIVRNITERKQVEYSLRAAREAADAASRAKSQFLATMSHELRTPLTSIMGYAELAERALKYKDVPEVVHDLGRIRTSGSHLLALINDVLDLSKIEAGRMTIQTARISLSPLIESLLATVRPLAERNGNRLVVELDPNADALVTDELRLRQILLNLLSNACKFTHEGTVTMLIRSAGPDAPISFAVQDTGIGIRPDQLLHLFEDFVQADASSTRKYGGTGLGLALSRRLAHLLGGEIDVVSEFGVGSCFTLNLPRAIAEGQAHVPSLRVVPDPAPSEPYVLDLAGSEGRIVLVIDDDPAVRDLLPRMLARPNLHFETATSGDEGLDLAAVLLPDLIILDVLLPDLDGWSVLRRLKADPETSHIPVLMLTIEPDNERGFVLGAVGVLDKPVDLEQLAQQITMALDHRPEQRQLLLVEDDDDIRGYLRQSLEFGGWQVVTAVDAETALHYMHQHMPDLAVVDLMLPGMNGIDLIATLRAMPNGQRLPIIVITACDLSQDELAVLHQSVEQVLHKGAFRSDELLRSTQALIGWHQQVNQAEGGAT